MTTLDSAKKAVKNPILLKRKLHGILTLPIIERLHGPNEGVYVMEEDWDNLVVLDACRYDSFAKYNPFEEEVEVRISRGETTGRFLEENFFGKSYHDTIYISGNAMVGHHAEKLDLLKLIGLWGDEELHPSDRRHRDLVPPEAVVEKTLEVQAKYPDKRIIAHFLQPHPPFVIKDGKRLQKGSKYRDFTAAREGSVSREEISEVYEENVEYVVKHVEELVDELGGKTVVTADHGEILGEGVSTIDELLHPRWRFKNRNRFDFAHYDHIRHPQLIRVPWVEIETDQRRDVVSASESDGADITTSDIEDQLEALGYR